MEAALDSLAKQTYANCQVLILDNASPADAQASIARLAESRPGWSVMRSDARIPMFENFQRGVDAAGGRYVTFLHDDDIYRDDFVSEHIAFLEAHPSVAFSGSNCALIDATGSSIGSRRLVQKTESWRGWRYIEALCTLGSNVFPMQTIMFRRDLLDARTFASAPGAHFFDFVILMRLAEDHDVGLIAKDLMELRTHDEQASRGLGVAAALDLRTEIFNAYCDELLARHPDRRTDIDRLRHHVRSARRSTAVWTWLNAVDEPAVIASRDALGTRGMDRWIRRSLLLADGAGLGRLLRTKKVRSGLRSAGHALAGRLG